MNGYDEKGLIVMLRRCHATPWILVIDLVLFSNTSICFLVGLLKYNKCDFNFKFN